MYFFLIGPLSLCSILIQKPCINLFGSGSLHAPTCYSSGERPSTPGDADAVFCVVASNDTQQAVPRGTGFAISKTYVFTARHNCVDDDGNLFSMVCLVKEIIRGEKLRRSAVIMLRHVVSNAADDWAVFERVGGEFACSVEICPEDRLPSAKEREAIGIKDFPAGLINTSSTAKLIVQSMYVKVCQYEMRLPDADYEKSTGFIIQFEDDSEVAVQSSPTVEDVIMVAGGRVSGSCGAPYFNTAGEVVAFHVESVDDTDAQSSSRSSHVSYSHGYVLCRLPSFVEWYERSIGTIGLHDGAGV